MTRRGLILRDAVAFLALLTTTIGLFAVTLVLFRSFEAQRAGLAQQWAARGEEAFAAKQPEQAVVAYRTALSYAPSEHDYELHLAESLAAAGHTEEAYAYFTGMWEAHPGDGLLNLQLARLAAARRDRTAAIDFYRASIDGAWDTQREGDSLLRRAEVSQELARFLGESMPGVGDR